MASPFLDIERLGKGVDLINDFSEELGAYIAGIEIAEDSTVIHKDNSPAYTRIIYSGSIADLNFSISNDSGAAFKQYVSGGVPKTGAEGQFYWPASMNVTGLDNIVKGGFETVNPTNLDTESSTTQTLSLSLNGEGDINAPFSANLNGEVNIWVSGGKVLDDHFSNPVNGNFNTGKEYMNTVLEVPIEYDEESKLVSIGEYDFADFDFSPDLSDYWAIYYNTALKPIADWWDSEFKPLKDIKITVPNPIEAVNSKVTSQIASGDNYAKKNLGKFISSQINSSSVKPFVDDSFLPLLKYSWNQRDYPAKFIDVDIEYDSLLDNITGATLERRNRTYSHIYEEKNTINTLRETRSSQRMKNLDESKSARFTFFSEEDFTRKNADIILNFSEKRGDKIALSSMKFDDIEVINYKHVENNKQFRRAKRGKANIIGFERKNRIDLYFDENAEDRGMGDGGIFSVLKSESEKLPMLISSDFVVI